MDAELLRRACEAAGFEQEDYTALGVKDVTREGFVWGIDDPALPSYVASLLVAKVREMPLPKRRRMANLVDREMSGQFERAAYATDEQRIRAALDVLEGE